MLGKYPKVNTETGSSLIEALVAIGVSASVLLASSSLLSSTVKANHDQTIRTETLVHAQAALQMIGNELKPIGNGVPFDQANFEINETSLTDPSVTYPIIVGETNESQIAFRLNETGEVALLTQDFDPAATTTVHLSEVSAYQANDPIFISNSVVSGSDGLYAKIQSVNSGS